MKIFTQRMAIQNVAKRWSEQYPEDRQLYGGLESSGEILSRLKALNLETCSPSAVALAISPNTNPEFCSWVTLKCSECQKSTDWILTVGEEPDYESHTANLCKECVSKAFALLPE